MGRGGGQLVGGGEPLLWVRVRGGGGVCGVGMAGWQWGGGGLEAVGWRRWKGGRVYVRPGARATLAPPASCPAALPSSLLRGPALPPRPNQLAHTRAAPAPWLVVAPPRRLHRRLTRPAPIPRASPVAPLPLPLPHMPCQPLSSRRRQHPPAPACPRQAPPGHACPPACPPPVPGTCQPSQGQHIHSQRHTHQMSSRR